MPKEPSILGTTRSPLADLLNLPANVSHAKKGKTPSTGQARVLTSAECLQMLTEKRQVQLEKERHKIGKGDEEATKGRGVEAKS